MRCIGYSKTTKKRCANRTAFLFCKTHRKFPTPYILKSPLRAILGLLVSTLIFLIFIVDATTALIKIKYSLNNLFGNTVILNSYQRTTDQNTTQIVLTNNSDYTILITELRVVIDKYSRLYGYKFFDCEVLPPTKYEFLISDNRDSVTSKKIIHSLLPNEAENFLLEVRFAEGLKIIEYHYEFLQGNDVLFTSERYISYGSCGHYLPFNIERNFSKDYVMSLCGTDGAEKFGLEVYDYKCKSKSLDSLIILNNEKIIKNMFSSGVLQEKLNYNSKKAFLLN